MRRFPAALVVSPFFVLASVAFSADPAGWKDALAAFEAAEYRKAVDLGEAVPADDPGAPKARYVAGEALLLLGEPARAEAMFKQVLAKRPKALPAKIGLARAEAAQGRLEAAEKALRGLLAADAKSTEVRRALGEVLLAAGRVEDADGVLKEAWKAEPKDPLVARAFAEVRLAADDAPQAEKIGAKLSKDLPKHPMGPFLKALALEKQGKDDDALRAYEEALSRDDRFLDAHKNLAILCHTRNPTYADRERTAKALEHYERYFALGGSDARLKEMYDTLAPFFRSR